MNHNEFFKKKWRDMLYLFSR